MIIEEFYYANSKWSCDQFPDLDSENTLVFFFAATQYKDELKPIEDLAAHYSKSKIVGCSTAGEIYQNNVFDDSIAVVILKFEHTNLKLVHEHLTKEEDSKKTGESIKQKLMADDLRHILVLSIGHSVNGTELVEGLNEKNNKAISVSGGLAGDSTRFEQTWTYTKEHGLCTDRVAAIGFYGNNISVFCGSAGGWDTFGLERVITKSKKNVLYEIDGHAALPLYKEYLGEHADKLPASALLFPMAIRSPDNLSQRLVRTILGIDEKTQSLTFAGDMPEGWYAQLMTFTTSHLLEGAKAAGLQAISSSKISKELLCIAISCVGRKLVLGEGIDEELDAVLSILPPKTKQIGFYSYGEISPTSMKVCELHNQTMTITLIEEE